jgi:Protein of unknown function (DUF2795)
VQSSKVPAAEPSDYERALAGVDFPASKFAILERSRDKGGIDREAIEMLERLPKEEYETLDELIAAVRALYVDDGYDPSALPL